MRTKPTLFPVGIKKTADAFNHLSYKGIHKRPNCRSLKKSGLFSKNEKLCKHSIIFWLGLHNVLPLICLK